MVHITLLGSTWYTSHYWVAHGTHHTTGWHMVHITLLGGTWYTSHYWVAHGTHHTTG